MKLSEFQNEEALDLLCDILEPTAKIFADDELREAQQKKSTKIELIKIAIKNHKSEVIDILARLDNIPREKYKCNIVTITMKLLDILNDEELTDFFSSQQQTGDVKSSIAVMENTKGKDK